MNCPCQTFPGTSCAPPCLPIAVVVSSNPDPLDFIQPPRQDCPVGRLKSSVLRLRQGIVAMFVGPAMSGQSVSQDAKPSTVAFVREEGRTLFSDLGLHVAIELLEWRIVSTPAWWGSTRPLALVSMIVRWRSRTISASPRHARYSRKYRGFNLKAETHAFQSTVKFPEGGMARGGNHQIRYAAGGSSGPV